MQSESSFADLAPTKDNSSLLGSQAAGCTLQAAARVRSSCVTAVRVHASLFTSHRQRITTRSACGDAALLHKSQPRAGAGPPPIGPRSEVGEDGDMATEPKTLTRPRWHQLLSRGEAIRYKHCSNVANLSKNRHTACTLWSKYTAAPCVSWLRGRGRQKPLQFL